MLPDTSTGLGFYFIARWLDRARLNRNPPLRWMAVWIYTSVPHRLYSLYSHHSVKASPIRTAESFITITDKALSDLWLCDKVLEDFQKLLIVHLRHSRARVFAINIKWMAMGQVNGLNPEKMANEANTFGCILDGGQVRLVMMMMTTMIWWWRTSAQQVAPRLHTRL